MTSPDRKNTAELAKPLKLSLKATDRKFLLGSVLLHVALLVLLLVSWQSREQVKAVQLPASIQARVLSADELAAMRDKREQEQRKIDDAKKQALAVKERAAQKKLEEQRKKEAMRKQDEAQKKARILEKKRQEEKQRKDKEQKARDQEAKQKKELDEKRRQEQARQKQEQLKKQVERERRLLERMREIESQEAQLKKQLEEGRIAKQLEFDRQQALEQELSETERFMALIRSRIESRWHIPPSSRKLTVVLRIRLLPTGELAAVKLLASSGQSAMDQSALSAVNSVRLFPVPDDKAVFEKYFRQFSMSFTPEQ